MREYKIVKEKDIAHIEAMVKVDGENMDITKVS
jgi:hypothetical protein